MNAGAPIRTRIQKSPLLRLLLGLVLVLAAVIAVQLPVTALQVSRPWRNLLLVLVTLPAAAGSYIAFFRWTENRKILELSGPNAIGEAALGVMAGALMFVVIVLVLTALGAFAISGSNSPGVLLVPFLIAIISAVFEEILFRGVLFRLLEEGLGSWLALLVSALVFGALHLINENATLMGAAAVALEAGIALAAAYMLTRRLWLPIGMHFAWNFTQSGVFGIAVSGNDPLPGLLKSSLNGPAWLTGGGFGVEASILAMIVGLLVAVIYLVLARRKGNVVPPPWAGPRS